MEDQSQDIDLPKKSILNEEIALEDEILLQLSKPNIQPELAKVIQAHPTMAKLKGNANDAEMMKPANPSDQDNEMEADVQKDISASKKEIEELMDREFEEQDKKI